MKKKRLKQKLLITLAMLALPICLHAEKNTLVVELKNSQTVKFNFLDKPVLTMNSSLLEIKTQHATADYKRSDVEKFYFSSEETAIDDVKESSNTLSIIQTGENIFEISHLTEKETILVTDLSGKLYSNTVSRNGTIAVVNLNGSPKGIYIFKIGKHNIKIQKK